VQAIITFSTSSCGATDMELGIGLSILRNLKWVEDQNKAFNNPEKSVLSLYYWIEKAF
jgi:hypothetical protein